jgi:DNA-binding transcriptional LysR family regulator
VDLELRHLTVFRVLAEELNFTRAGARLRLPQSAVTRHLQRLERCLGATLLARTTRTVTLTPAGEVLLDQVRRVEAAVEQLREAVAGAGPAPVLRVAAYQMGVAGVADRLTRALPTTRVTTVTTCPHGTLAQLERDEADLGIGYSPAGQPPALPPTARLVPLLDEPQYVALAATHPLAARDVVDLADLAGEAWVGPPAGSALAAVCAAAFAAGGIRPNILHTADSASTIRDLVSTGRAVSLATPLAAARHDDRLVVRPLRPAAHRLIWAAVRNHIPAEVVDVALTAVCDHYRSLAEQAGSYWATAVADRRLHGPYWRQPTAVGSGRP